MRRHVVLLFVLSGCDLVFAVDDREPSVCGPYGTPTPLVFGPELTDLTTFSVDATGTHGFVRARSLHQHGGGITAVTLADGVWSEDPKRLANLDTIAATDHILTATTSAIGELFAAIAPPDRARYRVFRYKLGAAGWGQIEQITPLSEQESTFPGGEVEIAANQQGTAFSRQVPILHQDDKLARSISIAVSDPPAQPWREVAIEGRLSTAAINEVHAPSGASLAGGPNGKLVVAYAATPVGSASGSRLFLAEKHDDAFPAGTRLFELEANGEELVEPWLSPDCATLYFRRTPALDNAGTIYMATRTNPQ